MMAKYRIAKSSMMPVGAKFFYTFNHHVRQFHLFECEQGCRNKNPVTMQSRQTSRGIKVSATSGLIRRDMIKYIKHKIMPQDQVRLTLVFNPLKYQAVFKSKGRA